MRKSLITIVIVLFTLLHPVKVYAAEPPVLEVKVLHKQYELNKEEEILLQQIALAEAGSQGIGGMTFVMQTILNRVESEKFPNTLKEVIFEKGQFVTVIDDLYKKYEITENSQKALKLLSVLENHGQLYFEAPGDETSTWHARNLTYVFEYEDHIFYK